MTIVSTCVDVSPDFSKSFKVHRTILAISLQALKDIRRSSALLPAHAGGRIIHVTRGEKREQRNESPSAAGHLIHSPFRRQVFLHSLIR